MANLTDADKVLRNDTGKNIVSALNTIAENLIYPDADNVSYDNTVSGLSATDVQSAVDELSLDKADKSDTYTKSEVNTLIDNLPEPMIFKGTLGVGGTIQTLPTASTSNEGWTYKVITDGTYSGQTAKSGDVFVSNGSAWVLIPSGDEDNDTWRAIKVNGTEKLGNAISSGFVDFVDTSDIKVTFDTNGNKVKLTLVKAIPTKTSELQNDSGFTTIDDTQTANNKTWSSEKIANSIPDVSNYYNKDEIDAFLEDKADTDGTYDLMTVGNAKQLKSNVGENDKVPYNFRTSGGSIDIGDRETDMLVGGTVAFNQLAKYPQVNNGYSTNTSYTGSLSYNNGVITNTANDGFDIVYNNAFVSGHKYFVSAYLKSSVDLTVSCRLRNPLSSIASIALTANTEKVISSICVATTNTALQFYSASATSGDTLNARNIMLIDLTAMFGSTIADYIYSLEQGTAGAGVAWFKKLFPKSYYAYNAGSLVSVKTSKHITTGFNAFDKSKAQNNKTVDANGNVISGSYTVSDLIRVIPNATYYFKDIMSGYYVRSICEYDLNGNYIGFKNAASTQSYKVSGSETLDSNCYYIRIVVYPDNVDTCCINLSWDGERDGEYEPYEEHTYALDSNLELRGIPKLDANNKLYYDGDTYESDGTVKRRYGIVDLGSLAWQQNTSGEAPFYYATLSSAYKYISGTQNNYICDKYAYASIGSTGTANGIFITNANVLRLRDSSISSASAISGYLVYELATPTTETADPFTNPQIVNDFGTEEYVDTRAVPIPVGHDTFYQANLRAKLEMAPDSPSGNGDYIVRQTDGQNEYVALTKELPTLPTTDGTYTLKCTVSSGTPTLSWVAD